MGPLLMSCRELFEKQAGTVWHIILIGKSDTYLQMKGSIWASNVEAGPQVIISLRHYMITALGIRRPSPYQAPNKPNVV